MAEKFGGVIGRYASESKAAWPTPMFTAWSNTEKRSSSGRASHRQASQSVSVEPADTLGWNSNRKAVDASGSTCASKACVRQQ